jgi:hypothetical protein
LGGGYLANPGAPYTAAYIGKFTSAGTYIWAKNFTTPLGVAPSSVAVGSNGNIALAGSFTGTLDFGNGPLNSDAQSGFVVKLSGTNGAAIWSKAIVGHIYYAFGTASASGVGVTMDAAGNVIVTGQFWEQCNLGGGNFIVPNVGTGDGFVAKYSAATGAYMSALQFGGTGNDFGISVTVDRSGNAIVTGTTQGGNFNGTTLTSNGGYDAFLMKLSL